MELSDAMDRVEELQKTNYEMLDYLRTHVAWLLEYCKKHNIPLPDLEKARLFFVTSGKILERNSPTESQQLFKTPDDSTEQQMLTGR